MEQKLSMTGKFNEFPPEIGKLLFMLDYVRSTTLRKVAGLSAKELDALPDAESNSIGALLLHIASGEFLIRTNTFEDRKLSDAEWKRWEAALMLGSQGRGEIRGNGLDYYVDALEEQRRLTLQLFRTVDDDWLYQQSVTQGSGAKPVNKYFQWFRVAEDELHHRGQISSTVSRCVEDRK